MSFEVQGVSAASGQPSWVGWNDDGTFYGPEGPLADFAVQRGDEISLPDLDVQASATDPVAAYAVMLSLFTPGANDVVGDEPLYGDWPFDEVNEDVVEPA